jgi:hypothetical protein
MRDGLVFDPQKAISEIQQWAHNNYRSDAGGVVRGVKNGKKSEQVLFNDFGDYIPFFVHLHDIDFCKQQIIALRNYRGDNYLLPNEFSYFKIPCKRSYEHSDYLLGLLDVYEHYPDLISREEVCDTLDSVYDAFFPNGVPHSWYFSTWPHRVPLADTKDGIFIELYLDAARILNDHKYTGYAQKIAHFFLSASSKKSLVVNVIPSNSIGNLIRPIFASKMQRGYVGVIKYNVSWWWSLLLLYRVTEDHIWLAELNKCHDQLVKKLIRDDGAVQVGQMVGDNLQDAHVLLVENFPAIDFLVDCAWFLKEETYVHTAKRIADFWLKYQNPVTGLFPISPDEFVDDLDNNTDIAVALFKLADITHDESYQKSAIKVVNGIWKYHRDVVNNVYVHSVDIRDGGVIRADGKVKFILLFLKLLILVSSDTSPIRDDSTWSLLRDR